MMIAHDSILGESCNDTTYNIVDIEGYDVFNVFTPNNDGSNDVFAFNEWMLNGIYVEIFNRWGQKVFHWEDVNSGWDGRAYSGRELEEGVYFYRMEATGVDGHHFEENGSITLLR
jgi:gliding motility-associated-like protein